MFLEKRRYRVQKISSASASKYFKPEESRETLKGKFQKSAQVRLKKYVYLTGAEYNGYWLGGLRHGKGKMSWPDGAFYEGVWQFNQAYGKGKFVHADGDLYEGEWRNNKHNGFGTYKSAIGAKYVGLWRDNLTHGNGVET